MTDQTYDPASAKRLRKQALTMARKPKDYESEPRGRGRHDDTEDVERDPATRKRDRKNSLTPSTVATEAGEMPDEGAVRGRGRTETVPQQDYDPAGAKKRRKQALTPSTLDPVE